MLCQQSRFYFHIICSFLIASVYIQVLDYRKESLKNATNQQILWLMYTCFRIAHWVQILPSNSYLFDYVKPNRVVLQFTQTDLGHFGPWSSCHFDLILKPFRSQFLGHFGPHLSPYFRPRGAVSDQGLHCLPLGLHLLVTWLYGKTTRFKF